MKVLFIEPKENFERLIDVSSFVSGGEYSFGVPFVVVDLVSYINEFDYVVTCIEHSCLSRNIIDVANELDLHTVLIMDGTFEYKNSIDNPYLKKVGFKLLKSNRFTFVFSPDILMKKYVESLESIFKEYMPKHAFYLREKNMEICEEKKVLLTTANQAYFNEEEFQRLVRLFNSIIKVLTESSICFSFRVFDERLIKELNIKPINNNLDCSFSDCLANHSHVITTPSTIVYTSILADRPTALALYRDVPITQPAGWLFYENKSLGNSVLNFLNSDLDRMNYQRLNTSNVKSPNLDLVTVRNKEKRLSLNNSFLVFNIEYTARCLFQRAIFSKLKKRLKNVFKS